MKCETQKALPDLASGVLVGVVSIEAVRLLLKLLFVSFDVGQAPGFGRTVYLGSFKSGFQTHVDVDGQSSETRLGPGYRGSEFCIRFSFNISLKET